jgi:hypothetical protein
MCANALSSAFSMCYHTKVGSLPRLPDRSEFGFSFSPAHNLSSAVFGTVWLHMSGFVHSHQSQTRHGCTGALGNFPSGGCTADGCGAPCQLACGSHPRCRRAHGFFAESIQLSPPFSCGSSLFPGDGWRKSILDCAPMNATSSLLRTTAGDQAFHAGLYLRVVMRWSARSWRDY